MHFYNTMRRGGCGHSAGLLVAALVITGLCYDRTWSSPETGHASGPDQAASPEMLITFDTANRLLVQAKESNNHGRPQVRLRQLMPDHGHLMHLLLVRVPGLDSMWHLHPAPMKGKGDVFTQESPSLPAGHYQAFADVVDNQGTAWTLVGALDVSQSLPKQGPLTGDDSAWSGTPLEPSPRDSLTAQIPDGGRIIWRRDVSNLLRANMPSSLAFEVLDSNGTPTRDLEPYMGMAAHAQIVRSDGGVFAHIHAAGPAMPGHSMAQHGGMGMHMSGMVMHSQPLSHRLNFFYTFPQPGGYRIFVQVKRSGQIETAAFDVRVQ